MSEMVAFVCACGRRAEAPYNPMIGEQWQVDKLRQVMFAGGHDPDVCSRASVEANWKIVQLTRERDEALEQLQAAQARACPCPCHRGHGVIHHGTGGVCHCHAKVTLGRPGSAPSDVLPVCGLVRPFESGGGPIITCGRDAGHEGPHRWTSLDDGRSIEWGTLAL